MTSWSAFGPVLFGVWGWGCLKLDPAPPPPLARAVPCPFMFDVKAHCLSFKSCSQPGAHPSKPTCLSCFGLVCRVSFSRARYCSPPPPCFHPGNIPNRTFFVHHAKNTRRLNVRHWPPAKPSVVPHAGADSSCDSYFSEEGAIPDRPSSSQAGGGGGVAETQAPRAVILAGSLSELPRSMRLGGAVVFTNLSSPEAWR